MDERQALEVYGRVYWRSWDWDVWTKRRLAARCSDALVKVGGMDRERANAVACAIINSQLSVASPLSLRPEEIQR